MDPKMATDGTVATPNTRTYCILLVAVFLALFWGKSLYELGVQLTCWAGGYGQNAWMAYCNSDRYGVYDVEAIWHRIEPEVEPAIRTAQVLTLTDSHMQNALSLGGASEWFAARGYSFYMLGVPTAESGFGERLLESFHPQPKVLILDASPYFSGEFGKFESPIFQDQKASYDEVVGLKGFQQRHLQFCGRLPWACGHNFSYFRSRLDGHWIFPQQSPSIWIGQHDVPNDQLRFQTGVTPNELLPLYPTYLEAARRLIANLNMPHRCIVVTHVPAADDLRSLAHYIAGSLDLTELEPDVPDLFTFDHAHLTPESSKRWTREFLVQLEPVLQRCAGARTMASATDASPISLLAQTD
jgi:hypothetical protein